MSSIIKNYCKEFELISINSDYRYANEIIVNKNLKIKTYQELLGYALKEEFKYYSQIKKEKVKEFLFKEKLILEDIPQFLFDKGYISENEPGLMKIN